MQSRSPNTDKADTALFANAADPGLSIYVYVLRKHAAWQYSYETEGKRALQARLAVAPMQGQTAGTNEIGTAAVRTRMRKAIHWMECGHWLAPRT